MCLCHYGPALLTFWFQTDLGRENSASYLKMQAGKTDAFHFSHHSHASRPIFMLYMIGHNLTREFMWKIFAASCDLFTLTAVADRVLCQPVIFLTVFSHWKSKWNTAAINSLLLVMAGLFIECLVEKCATCQSRKSDFGWHRFCFSPRLLPIVLA